MDVFSLREAVVREYEKFATSFTLVHAEDIKRQIEAIYQGARYWPEPLLQINPSYKPGSTVEALVAQKRLHPGCAQLFRAPAAPEKRSAGPPAAGPCARRKPHYNGTAHPSS
jgi:hypothetical protein